LVVNPLSPDLTYIAVSIAIVLLSLTVHEAAHAWSADRLGDPSARLLGRVSLNPVVHIDLVGTIILPIIAAVSNFPIIGWAKPVPVNTSRLAHPRRDFMIVAAAGPASNIALAVLAAVLVQLLPVQSFGASDGLDLVSVMVMAGHQCLPRRLQPAADSAARRRQRARRTLAAERGRRPR
jgi:Zn-dependent protease